MKHLNQCKHNKNTDLEHNKMKVALFAYSREETFRETKTRVAFQTRNTIENTGRPHSQIAIKKWRVPIEMYGLSTEIHRADQVFYTRHKEHIQVIN